MISKAMYKHRKKKKENNKTTTDNVAVKLAISSFFPFSGLALFFLRALVTKFHATAWFLAGGIIASVARWVSPLFGFSSPTRGSLGPCNTMKVIE